MSETRKYDSTVARIAVNIAAGLVGYDDQTGPYVADEHEAVTAMVAVRLARQIVAEVQRTEPVKMAENANIEEAAND